MGVRFEPTSKIKIALGIDTDGKIQKFATNICAKHMDKYVPMNTGNLADYRIEGNVVIYDQPYARYQYYGVREDGTRRILNRDLTKHPLATSYWDLKMVSAEMSDIIEEINKKMRN